MHREATRVGDGCQSAVRLHDVERLRGSLLELPLEFAKIPRNNRPDIRVHHSSAGAFKLPELARHVARKRDEQVREPFTENAPDLFFVLAVRVGVKKRNRDGVNANLLDELRDPVHFTIRQRLQVRTVMKGALVDLESELMSDKGD